MGEEKTHLHIPIGKGYLLLNVVLSLSLTNFMLNTISKYSLAFGSAFECVMMYFISTL